MIDLHISQEVDEVDEVTEEEEDEVDEAPTAVVLDRGMIKSICR